MNLDMYETVTALRCCTSGCDECDKCPVPQKLRDDCTCGQFVMENALTLIVALTEASDCALYKSREVE